MRTTLRSLAWQLCLICLLGALQGCSLFSQSSRIALDPEHPRVDTEQAVLDTLLAAGTPLSVAELREKFIGRSMGANRADLHPSPRR
jgi:hypothetical protein